MKKFLFVAATAALLAACATGGSPSGSEYAPAAAAPSAAGPLAMKDGMLVNSQGLTVYVFDNDVAGSGKSVCNGKCATNWPPVQATANDKPNGPFTIVVRDDGTRQWAYKGKPVYTWPEDQEPGDKYGDGKLNLWHIVKQ
jgi:predicted lipoprotein with Yx(FWY)xxD motif